MGQGESEGQSAITIGDGSREKKYPRGFSAALYLVSERGADEPVITLARLLLSARKHLHYDIRIDRFTGSERRKQRTVLLFKGGDHNKSFYPLFAGISHLITAWG